MTAAVEQAGTRPQHRSAPAGPEPAGHVEASWAYPPPTFRTAGEIAGDAGLATWDSDQTEPVRVWLRSNEAGCEIPHAPSTLAESPYTTEIRHFLSVLRGKADPIITAEDGLAALRLAAASEQSIVTGRPVIVEEV